MNRSVIMCLRAFEVDEVDDTGVLKAGLEAH